MYSPIPDPLKITFNSAKINKNCAPGAWVDPKSLPNPVNNGNWITSDENASCETNVKFGYRFFRLTLNLPSTCAGKTLDEVYKINFTGYVDNEIKNVYLNGVAKGISGGDFTNSGRINFQVNGPWKIGVNYIDILVWNYDVGGAINPYGLLLVADYASSSLSDIDNDGIKDIFDKCPCDLGQDLNGCTILDSDKDGVADEVDIDDDNDGVLDLDEAQVCLTDKTLDQSLENGNAIFENCMGSVDGPGVNFFGSNVKPYKGSNYIGFHQIEGFSLSLPNPMTKGNLFKLELATCLASITPWGWSSNYPTFVNIYASNGNCQSLKFLGKTTIRQNVAEGWFNDHLNFIPDENYTHLYFEAISPNTPGGFVEGIGYILIDGLNIDYCEQKKDNDTDGDGIVNRLDLDSDGDGCSDAFESGATIDKSKNYMFKGPFGSNGLQDDLETSTESGEIKYLITYQEKAINQNLSECLDDKLSVNIINNDTILNCNSDSLILEIEPCTLRNWKDKLLFFYDFNNRLTDTFESSDLSYNVSLTKDRFGVNNKAGLFNGINSFIQTNISGNVLPLTIAAFVNAKSILAEHSIIDSDVGGSYGNSLIIGYMNLDKTPDVQFHNGYSSYSNEILENKWYHLTAVIDFDQVKLYINGKLVHSQFYQVQYPLDGSMFRIGRHNESDPQWFNGVIDDACVWNRILCDKEIEELSISNGLPKDNFIIWSNGSTSKSIKVLPKSSQKYFVNLISESEKVVDSVEVSRYLLDSVVKNSNKTICTSMIPYKWYDKMLVKSGIYKTSSYNSDKCLDSIFYLDLTIKSFKAGSDLTICKDDSVKLNASGGVSYNWDNNVVNGVFFKPDQSRRYVVTGEDENGCKDTSSLFVKVNQLPNIYAGADTSVCFGSPAILKAKGAVNYQWDNGVDDKKSFTPQETKIYKVIGTDANGCKNSDEVEVKVNPNPDYELIVTDPCEKQTLAFTVNLSNQTSSVGVKSSIWTGGSNFNSSELNPQISNVGLNQKGIYNLTLTDNNNCQTQKSVTANVSPEDQIDFADLGAKCLNDIIFTLPEPNIKGGSWSTNDNTSIQDEKQGLFNPSKSQPNSEKKVEVTYTTSSVLPTRKCPSQKTKTIIINSLPSIDGGKDTIVCFGTIAILKANGGISYQWDNGVEDKKSFITQATKVYKVIGTDVNGCKNSDEVEVKVNPNPEFELSVNDPCEKQTLAFSVNLGIQTTSVGVKSSIWSGGTNFTSNELNPQIPNVALSQKGSYSLTLTDNNNCQIQKSIIANVSPEDQIDFADLGSKCVNDLIFSLPIVNIKGGSWYSNDNTSIQDEKNGLFDPSKSKPNSDKKVEVTYTSSTIVPARKCPSQKTKIIIINPIPDSMFYSLEQVICEQDAISFKVLNPNMYAKYFWEFGDGTKKEGLNPIYTYTRDGLFTVKLTSFLGDCKVQQVKNEYIKVIPKPKDIDFIPNVIEIDFYNPDVEFNTYTKGKYYEWSFGDETGSTEQNPKHKYSMVPGSYLVTLRVSNMENHCDQSVAKVLLMPEPLVYFIPNTFSPNGDEINNVFQPIFTYGYDPERYSFYVYNRWGLLVFESHNTTIGWDGTFGNELASNDTYVWKLEFKEKSVDRMHSVQGTVNLLR